MGFYLRKSVSIGPFRFNLSGSGIGVSFGVRGFRIGSGPRGNSVHLGRGGLYYRHTFRGDPQPPSTEELSDSTPEDWLEEIRAKRRGLSVRSWVIVVVLLFLLIAMATRL